MTDYGCSVSEQAMEAWKRYIRRDDSRLVDLFVGQLKVWWPCFHRRRINTEEKAKVVAAGWGMYIVQYLNAASTI